MSQTQKSGDKFLPDFVAMFESPAQENTKVMSNDEVMARSIARSVARVVANARLPGYESECLRLMKARDAKEFIDNLQSSILTSVDTLKRKKTNGAGSSSSNNTTQNHEHNFPHQPQSRHHINHRAPTET